MAITDQIEERTVGYILTGPYCPTSSLPDLDQLRSFLCANDVTSYTQSNNHYLLYPPAGSQEERLVQLYPFLCTKAFNAAYRIIRKAVETFHCEIPSSFFSVIRDPPMYKLVLGQAPPSTEDFIFYEQLAKRMGRHRDFEQACKEYSRHHENSHLNSFKRESSSVKELARGDWHNISIIERLTADTLRYYAAKYHPKSLF